MFKKLKSKKISLKAIKDEIKSMIHHLGHELAHKKYRPVSVIAHRPRRHR